MSKTLADLRTGVRMYLDESAQTDFLDTEVDREINYAYQDLVTKVVEVYEDFYVTTTPVQISTVANQQEYSLATAILKVTRVEVNYDPANVNSSATRATAIKMAELPLNLTNNALGVAGSLSSGYFVYGSPTGQKIGLVPVPSQNGTNAISVWGVQAPSDLASATPTDNVVIPYPDAFAKLIELKAASELLRKGQQEEGAAQQYLANYLTGVLNMQTFLKERQADGPWMIQDALMENVDFDNSL